MIKAQKGFTLALLLSLAALPGCSSWKKNTKSDETKKVASRKSKGNDVVETSEKFFEEGVDGFVFAQNAQQKEGVRLADADFDDMERAWARQAGKPGEFEKVMFDFDNAKIREDQKPIVAYDAEQVKRLALNDEQVVRVEGYADQKFLSRTYNDLVSYERAKEVADEVATQSGLDRKHIKVIGYGDAKPVVNNPGKAEQLNRRVEFTVV